MKSSFFKKKENLFIELISAFPQKTEHEINSLTNAYNLLVKISDASFDKIKNWLLKYSDQELYSDVWDLIKDRVTTAKLVVFRIHGNADEAIIALLLLLYYSGAISPFELSKNVNNKVVKDINSIKKRLEVTDIGSEIIKAVDVEMFYFFADVIIAQMDRELSTRSISNSKLLRNAYSIAKDAHKNMSRKSGEPYIIHPVMVAKSLCDLRFESDVICAALLHDIIEDSSYTVDDISSKLNVQIAKYVEAVTSVDKEYKAISAEDPRNGADNDDRDIATVYKLIERIANNDSMLSAVCIKAADRVNNLSTFEAIDVEKQNSKIYETTTFYLPLFRKLNINYFLNQIADLCWKTSNQPLYQFIEMQYNRLITLNSEFINRTRCILQDIFNHKIKDILTIFGEMIDYRTEIYECSALPFEINEEANKMGFFDRVDSYINKHNVFTRKFDIVLDVNRDEGSLRAFYSTFIKGIKEHHEVKKGFLSINDFDLDNNNKRVSFIIEDSYYNKYQCNIYLREDYLMRQFGSPVAIEKPENFFYEERTSPNEKITVKTKDNEIKILPKGSTVIDFAFELHEDVGLALRGVKVNGKSVSIFTLLNDGDKIDLIADTVKNGGRHINHAKLFWLRHVETKKAMDKIIKYFERKYEGSSSEKVFDATDENSNTIVTKLLTQTKSIISVMGND